MGDTPLLGVLIEAFQMANYPYSISAVQTEDTSHACTIILKTGGVYTRNAKYSYLCCNEIIELLIMSVWVDIHKRSRGIQIRKEDYLPLFMSLDISEKGKSFPAEYPVPDDVRKIRIAYLLCPKDDEASFLFAEALVWAYKSRKKDIEAFEKILSDVLMEFDDLSYDPTRGSLSEKLSDRTKEMIRELRNRVSKHNEEICGIPVWNDNPVASIID